MMPGDPLYLLVSGEDRLVGGVDGGDGADRAGHGWPTKFGRATGRWGEKSSLCRYLAGNVFSLFCPH